MDEPGSAQEPPACEQRDLGCWQELQLSECARPQSSLETCLVLLQHLETTRRRGADSADMALLLGKTLHDLALKDGPPTAKERFLARARAAYGEAVRREPFNASGYLGLAEVAASGEERVEWLRGAVRAESQPAHMELLANALSVEIDDHTGDLEAAHTIEDAYTFESRATEKWRYGASAWHRYREALDQYPSAVSERSLENVVLRIKDDVDYSLIQRALLEPESHLVYLADAFATLCEQSIAEIIGLDECIAGLESAVASAERPTSPGARRLLAEAALTGMRTIAGESLPRSVEARGRFSDWIDRLLLTRPEPVDVAASLLEARGDYTPDLLERADLLRSAIELSPNRGDLRLKAGATYVDLTLWYEALEQLRVARFFSPPEDYERIDELAEAAELAYQAQFLPPAVRE
jgi:hypothetical protein